MLGPSKRRDLDRPAVVSLERLVPQNHFYRQLDAELDLSFVRSWVADRYADRGRPSIDPVVFFRFQLIMFFEGIRSERKLVELASLNLAQLAPGDGVGVKTWASRSPCRRFTSTVAGLTLASRTTVLLAMIRIACRCLHPVDFYKTLVPSETIKLTSP